MRTTRIAAVFASAAVVLAGYSGIAFGQTAESHVLTLRLPDGQVERVQYFGDVPPNVVLEPEAVRMSAASGDPFALLQRMMADMDRQAEAMFQSIGAEALPGPNGYGVTPVGIGHGGCMRSVQITFAGDGRAPHVVSHTAGDCGSAPGEATPAAVPAVGAVPAPGAPKRVPGVVEVKALPGDHGLLRLASNR